MFLVVFVDDLVLVYLKEDENEWNELKINMLKKFKMKDLGNIEWILGMKIERDRNK